MTKKTLKHRTSAQRRAAFKLGARNSAPVSDGGGVREATGPTVLLPARLSAESPVPAALPPLPVAGPLAKPDALPTVAVLSPGARLQAALARFATPAALLAPLGAADA